MRPLAAVLAALLLWTAAPTPSAPAAPAPAVPLPAAAAPQALFFGDSYFVGGGCSPDRDRGMAHVAARALGYAPVIRGAGGTGFVAGNPEYDIPPYLAQVREGAYDGVDPALVVVEGGTNDIGRSITKIRRNAERLLRVTRSRFPDARIIVVGPMQTYGPWSDTDAIRDTVRSVARGLGMRFVNPQKWTAGNDELLCSDYVHPTYEGHRVLGQRLADALERRGA